MKKATKELLEKWRALGLADKGAMTDNATGEKIWRKFMLDFNYNSNHIEGNTLTYGQTELLLLFGQVTGDAGMREYEEMKSHNVALEMVREESRRPSVPLNETFIRQLHHVLLREDYTVTRKAKNGKKTSYVIHAGRYKTRPNSVITATGELFRYASPEETPSLMADLVKWYNKAAASGKLDPVQLAALFHYRYIRIHPFEDGNGRIARLMMNFILYRYNFPMIVVPSKGKAEYLAALNKCDAVVGLDPTDGANAEIENVEPFVDYIENLLIDEMWTDVAIAGGTAPQWWCDGELVQFTNANIVRIIEIIEADPKASIRNIADAVGINPSAVQKHINTLKDSGYLLRLNGTRGDWHLVLTRL